MILGLDFYGTITLHPKHYAKFSRFIIDHGGEVQIITAIHPGNERELKKALSRSHVPYSGLSILTYTNYHQVPAMKLQKALELHVDMFVDDRVDVLRAMEQAGILTLQS